AKRSEREDTTPWRKKLISEKGKRSSKLMLWNCDLGVTSFLHARLHKFDIISICNTRLTTITTTNGHFPLASNRKENTLVFTQHEGEFYQYIPVMEETYNHLYEAMKKSGNRTQENRYYAEYMEWHRRNPQTPLATKTSLWLHKMSSSYGQDWIRGAIVATLVALFFYNILLITSGFDFGIAYLKSPHIEYHLGHFFLFILPIHRTNFLGFEMPDLALMVDFFARLAIGFMIYQTITAFRRFSKR
ncbi:MAG: hypothetical protein AAGA85_26185, partial [Bacteroidota bacterium]